MSRIKKLSIRRLNIVANSIEGVDIEERIYDKGDVLFEEGTTSTGLYFIDKGTILLTTRGADGSEVIIRTGGSNDFIGFLSLIREVRYTATAMAMEDNCQVRFISREIFREALKDGRFATDFMKILCDRILSIEDHIIDLRTKTVRQRLATVLISFDDAFEQTGDGQVGFISLKRKDIANIVGITPETLSRQLADFEQEGLVELHTRGVKVVETEKLLHISNISD